MKVGYTKYTRYIFDSSLLIAYLIYYFQDYKKKKKPTYIFFTSLKI